MTRELEPTGTAELRRASTPKETLDLGGMRTRRSWGTVGDSPSDCRAVWVPYSKATNKELWGSPASLGIGELGGEGGGHAIIQSETIRVGQNLRR